MTDYTDPKFRFEERVKRLMATKQFDRETAEECVRDAINHEVDNANNDTST